MRIAQIAPPYESIPPTHYGRTERVISLLTKELVRRRHEVTLFASGDSRTLTVGSKAPAESGTYVRAGGDSAIYLVSNALIQDLERLVTEPPRPPSPTPLPSPSPAPAP